MFANLRLRRIALAVPLSLAAVVVPMAATPASAAVPQAPVTLPADIEVMPPYQPQTFCDPVAKKGVVAFADLLTQTYAGTSIVSLARPCGTDTSEHYDGRAIDWGVDHRNDKQRAQGKAFLQWLFATDASGNTYAMLRRLGIMYVIWNKRIWGSWDQSWQPYTCSGVTACHVDHMHLSFDWSGAEKKTSFWTGIVAPPMAPPLLALRKMHDPHTQQVAVRDDQVQPVYRLVSGARYRLTVTGRYRYDDHRRHHADALCSTTDGTTWTAQPATTDGSTPPPDLLKLSVNGSHHWRPLGTATSGCSADHTYRRTISVDKRTPLQFAIDDPTRSLGNGSLTVTVERIG